MVRVRPSAPLSDFPRDEVPSWAIELQDKTDLILNMLEDVLQRQEWIMGTYKDLGDAIARNTSAGDSVLQMLTEVTKNLKEAQALNDPAAMDAAIANLDANTGRLAAAAVKSTPVDPTPTQPLPPAPPETPPPA